MTKSATNIPSTNPHPPVSEGTGSIGPHTGSHFLRPGCDFVAFDKQSTVYRGRVSASKLSLPVPENAVFHRTLRQQAARFDLEEIVENNRRQKKIIASQSGKA